MLGLVSEAPLLEAHVLRGGVFKVTHSPPNQNMEAPGAAQRFLLLTRAWLKDPGGEARHHIAAAPRGHPHRFRRLRLHGPRLRRLRKPCPTSGQAAGTVASVESGQTLPSDSYQSNLSVNFVFSNSISENTGPQEAPDS